MRLGFLALPALLRGGPLNPAIPIAQLSRITRMHLENPTFFDGSGEKKCEKKWGK